MAVKNHIRGGLLSYDEILRHIGQFGLYQIRIHFLLWLVSAASGLAVVVWAFTGFKMNYRCVMPHECESLTTAMYSNPNATLVIPEETLGGKHQLCNYKELKNVEDQTNLNCHDYLNKLNDPANFITKKCDASQLVFDRSVVKSSIMSEYGFTCGSTNLALLSIVGSTYMLGLLFGSLFFGFISDRYGRMTSLMLAVLFVTVSALFSAVIPTAAGFGFFRFITGMGGMGCFMVTFVLAVEYVGFKYTMLIGIVIEVPFALGEILLGIEAIYIRDWYTLQLVAYLPWILLLGLWFLIPESPRWLIAVGRYDEAIKIINKMAKVNKRTVPAELLDLTLASSKEMENQATKTNQVAPNDMQASAAANPTVLDLFKPTSMMIQTLNMFYQWFAVTMCYYGLSFASTSLGGDAHTNFLLSVAIEIPGYIFCVLVMDCWGRRPILSFCQAIAGISCIIAGLLFNEIDPKEEGGSLVGAQVFFSLIGKFMASANFAIIYVYTAELYPTIIRNTAIGSCSSIARIGAILALVLQLLSSYYKPAPMLIMGIAALVAGVMALKFPETVGNKLPETMEEAINIGKSNSSRGICTCVCPKSMKEMFKEG